MKHLNFWLETNWVWLFVRVSQVLGILPCSFESKRHNNTCKEEFKNGHPRTKLPNNEALTMMKIGVSQGADTNPRILSTRPTSEDIHAKNYSSLNGKAQEKSTPYLLLKVRLLLWSMTTFMVNAAHLWKYSRILFETHSPTIQFVNVSSCFGLLLSTMKFAIQLAYHKKYLSLLNYFIKINDPACSTKKYKFITLSSVIFDVSSGILLVLNLIYITTLFKPGSWVVALFDQVCPLHIITTTFAQQFFFRGSVTFLTNNIHKNYQNLRTNNTNVDFTYATVRKVSIKYLLYLKRTRHIKFHPEYFTEKKEQYHDTNPVPEFM